MAEEDKIQVEKVQVERVEIPVVKDVFPQSTDLIGHLSIAKHFNIDLPDNEQFSKLRAIYNYARSVDPEANPEKVLIRLERRLGQPRLGETMLDKMHRYITLTNDLHMTMEKLEHVQAGPDLPREQ